MSSKQSELSEAITDLVITIFRLNGALIEQGDRQTAPFGLRGAQWQVMGAIACNQTPMNAPQIARFIGITRQAVQKQLKILLKKEMISCCPNPNNERSPLYVLTAKGQEKTDAMTEVHRKNKEQYFIPQFSLDEIKVTKKTLEKLFDGLGRT